MDAIREIVLNMIVHRDYRSSSESIIKIFDDHILFFNPGHLPDSISIEQLMSNDYVSTPYNKQIANLFKAMGMIERFGTGVKRVCNIFMEYGLPKPEWKLMPGGLGVKVFTNSVSEGTTEKSTEKTTEKILSLIKINPNITTDELAAQCGISSDGVYFHTKKLRDVGKIKRIGSKKGGHWEVNEG